MSGEGELDAVQASPIANSMTGSVTNSGTELDETFMRRAIDLAERARGHTSPNPQVGSVVLDKTGIVVGEGRHRKAGTPHAEREALLQAGERALGGTLYVTLEPCCHQGRTPPCVEAVLASGVQRVVVAQLDPDEHVAGRSIDLLRKKGLQVDLGVCAAEATAQIDAYLHHRRTGYPLVVLKTAVTVDGRIAAPDGSSKWITGKEARADVHRLRHDSDAVLVGSGTVLADDPQLTVRIPALAHEDCVQPLRVVVDARGRVPSDAALLCAPGEALIVTCDAPTSQRIAWEKAGAEVVQADPGPEGGVDLDFLCHLLGKRGVLQLLIEGGADLAGNVLRTGHWDKLVIYVGGMVAGGETALSAFAGSAPARVDDFTRLRLQDLQRFGDDLRLVYLPVNR